MSLEAIKWVDGSLEILDQLLLPLESKYIKVKNTKIGWEVINKMQVRGAPAIAIVACLSLAAELVDLDLTNIVNKKEMFNFICEKMEYLFTSRPTAINIKISGKELINFSKSLLEENEELEAYRNKIIEWCIKMMKDDVDTNKQIGAFGCQAILEVKNYDLKEGVVILTHCNTGSLATAGYGTALGVVRSLQEKGKLVFLKLIST